MVDLDEISLNLQRGRARETSALVHKAIEEKYNFDLIIQQGIMKGIKAAEEQFRRREIFTPEFGMAARALEWGMRPLKKAIASTGKNPAGTVILGTVEGDAEDIEKNIIAVMLEDRGLRTCDLGSSVSTREFIDAATAEGAQVILCFAALASTMHRMKALVQAAGEAKMRNKIKIVLYGRPVTDQYCQAIEADSYAPDATAAVAIVAAYCKHV
jgi:methanogenic corrinoid protein MtbC1